MPRQSNILQFPSSSMHGFKLKLFAVLFYLFLAWMLTYVLHADEGALGFLILLGFLYHFFLKKQTVSKRYLQQNSVLLIILFLLALLAFPLTLIPVFGIIVVYWLLIGRTSQEAPYFTRFHILTGLILNFLILMAFLILLAAIDFAGELLRLFKVLPLFIAQVHAYGLFILWGVFWAAAIWLSFAALLGRTPYIGLVTNNIRYWT
jgi:hypothetical protein